MTRSPPGLGVVREAARGADGCRPPGSTNTRFEGGTSSGPPSCPSRIPGPTPATTSRCSSRRCADATPARPSGRWCGSSSPPRLRGGPPSRGRHPAAPAPGRPPRCRFPRTSPPRRARGPGPTARCRFPRASPPRRARGPGPGPGQVLATVSNIAQSSSASSRCRVRGRTRRSPVIASHEASPLLTRSRPRRT